MPVVLTRDPKIAEDVLTSSSCTNRSPHAANAIADAVGPGLITLQGTVFLAPLYLFFLIFLMELYRNSVG